jgi:hypothetical protein
MRPRINGNCFESFLEISEPNKLGLTADNVRSAIIGNSLVDLILQNPCQVKNLAGLIP